MAPNPRYTGRGRNVETYDPSESPKAEEWLATDEDERTAMVAAWHRRARVRLPSPRMHAMFHVIVENQLALGWEAVVEAEARLRGEGLSRHEAIHAIGSVVATDLFERMKAPDKVVAAEANAAYVEALKRLTAAGWRASG